MLHLTVLYNFHNFFFLVRVMNSHLSSPAIFPRLRCVLKNPAAPERRALMWDVTWYDKRVVLLSILIIIRSLTFHFCIIYAFLQRLSIINEAIKADWNEIAEAIWILRWWWQILSLITIIDSAFIPLSDISFDVKLKSVK